MKLLVRYDILKTMKNEIKKVNGHLTPVEHDFFIFLVQVINEMGVFDEEQKMYFIRVPFKSLAETSGISAKLVTPALKKFKEYNLIKIVEVSPKDKIIFMDLSVYEQKE